MTSTGGSTAVHCTLEQTVHKSIVLALPDILSKMDYI